MNIRRALWRFITVAGKGLRATRITSVSLGSMSLEERLYWLACALFRLPDRVITAGNNRLYLPKRSVMASAILLHGGYEAATTAVFQELVQPGMTVVDAGAHVGYFTLLAAGLVGETGRVYAFEPEPSSYELLCKNIRVNGYINVVTIPKAVSNKQRGVKLWLDKVNLPCSSFSEDNALFFSKGNLLEKGVLEVETIALDDFFENTIKNDKVDVIKLDTQGAEGLIVEGAGRTLRSPNLKVFMEFWPYGIRNVGTDPLELLYKLQEYGFTIKLINEKNQALESIETINFFEKAKSGEEFNLLLEK